MHGELQVMDRIQGKGGRKLPWEATPMKPRLKQKLGMFRELVLQVLNRDPAKRPSMRRFCDACHHLMSSTVTVRVPRLGGGSETNDIYEDDECHDIISERELVRVQTQAFLRVRAL